MKSINELHEQAMDFADQAFVAKHRGDRELAQRLFYQAFERESTAAELIKDDIKAEPTRSVLYRSAAMLAMDCGELRAAEQLIATALSGNPPQEIVNELRDLLEQVNFVRHLALREVELAPFADGQEQKVAVPE